MARPYAGDRDCTTAAAARIADRSVAVQGARRMRRAAVGCAHAPPARRRRRPALAGCPRPIPKPPLTSVELTREDRLAIATLEAQRDAAVGKLRELADDRHAGKRALALRALGRIGSAEADRGAARAPGRSRGRGRGRRPRGRRGHRRPRAGRGQGDRRRAGRPDPERTAARHRPRGDRAPGHRRGDGAAVAGAGRGEPEVVAAAAIGLGRLGRAKIALDDTTELALIGLTRHAEVRVRYAATFALARAMTDPSVVPAAHRSGDPRAARSAEGLDAADPRDRDRRAGGATRDRGDHARPARRPRRSRLADRGRAGPGAGRRRPRPTPPAPRWCRSSRG
jgi:hypothetical protein